MESNEWRGGGEANLRENIAETARLVCIAVGLGLIVMGVYFVIRLCLSVEELRKSLTFILRKLPRKADE